MAYATNRGMPPLWPLAILAIVGAYVFYDWYAAYPMGTRANYVGRETCAKCHQAQDQLYRGSDHDMAMDHATADTVLGDFNNRTFKHFDVETRFHREGDKFLVTTEGADGKPATFEVRYTFGYRPLQQYMVEFPDGRVQVLSAAWDTEKKQWFDLHPEERIPAGDWLHWTGAGQNWNYMCAECHSTNLRKNYDPKSDTYHTEYDEIDVSCEACHGPGSLHVELASSKSLFWDRHIGYGLPNPMKGPDATAQLDTCARCHSRRRVVKEGYQPGDPFLDYYEPELIDSGLYFADGQILEEVYEHGSFLQSRMHREGVRCTDCHDPHSTRVKFPDNRLCLQCHTPSKGPYDTPAHHHHKPDSRGASCVECHMPTRTYMEVDPRRDHSLRVPRPDLTVKLGVPNACQQCHNKSEETAQWAADKVVEWFGPTRKQDPHYGEILAAGRAGQPQAVDMLATLAQKYGNSDQAKNASGIVRASAVALLGNYPLTEIASRLKNFLGDVHPLVRLAAVKAFDPGQRLDPRDQAQSGLALRIGESLGPMMEDSVRVVRTEAARVLAAVPIDMLGRYREMWNAIIQEWRNDLDATIDDAGAHLAIALVLSNRGNHAQAREQYQIALRLHPNEMQAIQARVNLALLENLQGHNADAERLYREAIALMETLLGRLEQQRAATDADLPTLDSAIAAQRRMLGQACYSLGLLLAETPNQLNLAVESLDRAAKYDDHNARLHYNRAAAYQQLNRPQDAEAAYLDALRIEPGNLQFMELLTNLYLQQGQTDKALKLAQELVRRNPAPQYRTLLDQAVRRATQPIVGPQPQ